MPVELLDLAPTMTPPPPDHQQRRAKLWILGTGLAFGIFIASLIIGLPVVQVACLGVVVVLLVIATSKALSQVVSLEGTLDAFLTPFDLEKMTLPQNVGIGHDASAFPWQRMIDNCHYSLREHLEPPVEASRAVRTLLADPRPLGRAQAAMVCGVVRDQEAIPILFALLADPDADVRFAAGLALSCLEAPGWPVAGENSSDPLLAGLSRLTAMSPLNEDHRLAVLQALRGGRRIHLPLVRLAARLDIDTAKNAADAASTSGYPLSAFCEELRRVHDGDAAPVLRELLRSGDEVKVVGVLDSGDLETELLPELEHLADSDNALVCGMVRLKATERAAPPSSQKEL